MASATQVCPASDIRRGASLLLGTDVRTVAAVGHYSDGRVLLSFDDNKDPVLLELANQETVLLIATPSSRTENGLD